MAGQARDEAASARAARRPRADAERNRATLLEVAQRLYAEQGIDVSLEEIARCAGVGIGTLYRNFPRGKEQLVAEALVGQATRYVAAAQRALAADDPWQGFTGFVREMCTLQAGDLGLGDLLAMMLPASERVEELRRKANELIGEILDRATATGKLRADLVAEDLLLLLIANAAVVQVTRHDAPQASRRMVDLFLAAVGTARARPPLADPPSPEQMRQAMTRLASSRGCAADAGPR